MFKKENRFGAEVTLFDNAIVIDESEYPALLTEVSYTERKIIKSIGLKAVVDLRKAPFKVNDQSFKTYSLFIPEVFGIYEINYIDKDKRDGGWCWEVVKEDNGIGKKQNVKEFWSKNEHVSFGDLLLLFNKKEVKKVYWFGAGPLTIMDSLLERHGHVTMNRVIQKELKL